MKRRNAFTLVELLVVVAIILLLLAILIPALNRSVLLAHRVQCASNNKQMMTATLSYLADSINVFPPHRAFDIVAGPNWYHLVARYAPGEELARCPSFRGIRNEEGVDWQWVYDHHNLGYGYNSFFLGHYGHNHGSIHNFEAWKCGTATGPTYISSGAFASMNQVKSASTLIAFADSERKIINGVDGGVSLSLWWPLINHANEGVNGKRHENAAAVAFVDGHAEIVDDPDNTVNPMADNTDDKIEYWDPQVRYRP